MTVNRKVRQVRRKKFCNRSCSVSYHNYNKPKRQKKVKFNIATATKGEVFARYKNWQSARSVIRRHAKNIYMESGQF